ncbi:MAG TPA: hypothetical protein VLN57_20845 [Xanthobacteraceae bacterium]|nr:hypothetical protein [Xanthobacteraceae bacterium]
MKAIVSGVILGLVIAGVLIGIVFWIWPPLIEPIWRGIDRNAASCIASDWFGYEWTCVEAGRRFACVREGNVYDCAEVRP